MEPIYTNLTEEQRDTVLEYAASGGLAIETGDDEEKGRYYARLLPADPGAPGWTGDAIRGLESALGLG